MHKPIRITRREMLKCILATPLSIVLASMPAKRGEAQLDQFGPPDFETVLLWEGRTPIDNTWRDIKGNNAHAFATISHAVNYSQLVWSGYKLGTASVEMQILARSVDLKGKPIGASWFPIARGTIHTPPQRWFQLIITEVHWDEYRIELRSPSPQQVHSRVLARWDYLPK